MSKIGFTKEGAIDIQVSFQEIWGQMPIDKRHELFSRFVQVTEFLESLVLIAPSARYISHEVCSRIECTNECDIFPGVVAWFKRPSCPNSTM
jgi:hypothetical protein